VRGWTAPAAVLTILAVLALYARVGRRLVPYLLATIPLLISIVLINTFLYPRASDTIFELGPFHATATGLTAALQATMRVVAFALSVAVFALTTRTDELVDDLERRGLGRRATFVIATAVGTVPRMGDRAREIVESQRARGMDTEGGIRGRIRGVLPLAGPLVLSALTEVEQRTMALEARAFAAPGRRTVLRPYPDSGAQRALRWALTLLTVVLLVAAVGGYMAWLP
jgi:energy-coupling factor transport system permease protein